MTKSIEIKTEFIRLDALLKLSSLVQTGGDAKIQIQEGKIRVDGEICTQRGRKIRPENKVEVNGIELTVRYSGEKADS